MPGLTVEVETASDPSERTVELKGERFLVGRGRDCKVRILEDQVSRHHALMVLVNGRWMIEDLDSSNGMFLNDKRCALAELRPGDILRLGGGGATFRITALDPPPPRDDEGLLGTRIIRLRERERHPEE